MCRDSLQAAANAMRAYGYLISVAIGAEADRFAGYILPAGPCSGQRLRDWG